MIIHVQVIRPSDILKSTPNIVNLLAVGLLYWTTFVVANCAAIIASQAMISGAFAVISQSLSLSCFPRVKIVHTSIKYEGQVYIPEINYFLMIACVVVTYAFKSTENIGHAYGEIDIHICFFNNCTSF